ncbi:hypothetical protein FHS95_003913 [Sphingomonas naasensis]|uniref:Uncharacterized protein n=1 Tax=Sphingomonas naasensis TaxID=1344951 RepID=A0A4S1WCT9_9SPHN|nr:hypothetical protein [Sphingomonas naasensis]NIJ22198.1 hypothetical protein [Sphingomonas naasensis]TGX40781.1 hypothetical protein E5A74_14970 [Sphingomonas naasensis]
MSLLAFLGLVRGFDLAALPAPAGAQNGASATERQALRALTSDVSKGGVTIEGERLFTVGKDLPWNAIAKRIDNLARERGAKPVALPGADPGKKLAQAWRAGDGRGVMVAMVRTPGGGAVAYFGVRFTGD